MLHLADFRVKNDANGNVLMLKATESRDGDVQVTITVTGRETATEAILEVGSEASDLRRATTQAAIDLYGTTGTEAMLKRTKLRPHLMHIVEFMLFEMSPSFNGAWN